MKRIFSGISGIFSFETIFVLYLFAGQYKQDEIFMRYFPHVDLTPALMLLSVIIGVYIFLANKMEIKKEPYVLLFIFLTFLCYTGLSLSWSRSYEYGATKTLYLAFQNGWNIIAAAIIIAPDPRRLRRFMFALLIISLIYVVMSILFITTAGNKGPVEFGKTHYDGVSYVISMGLAVLIFYLIDPSQNKLARVSSFALCCTYFVILLFVGHRGSFLATVIVAVAIVFLQPKKSRASNIEVNIRKKHIIFLMVFLISIMFVLPLLSEQEPVTLDRLLLLSEPTEHNSSLTRLIFYKKAFQIWSQNPFFGSGIGSFPIAVGWPDKRLYPHNIVLEILAELGLVGLVIFGLFLFYGVRMLIRNFFSNYPLSIFVFMVFVMTFFDALIGGDISDHRLMMVAMGLMMFPEKTAQMIDNLPIKVSILPEVKCRFAKKAI